MNYITSDDEIRELAFSLVNEAMLTVELQRRRVRSTEPEDKNFVFRYWADLQFLIIAFQRLRRAAEMISNIPSVSNLEAELKKFDDALPTLSVMRNVGEHIDEYALDKGYRKDIDRRSLQVGKWDGATFEWLGAKLNIDDAYNAAAELHQAVRNA